MKTTRLIPCLILLGVVTTAWAAKAVQLQAVGVGANSETASADAARQLESTCAGLRGNLGAVRYGSPQTDGGVVTITAQAACESP